jgi:quinol monooxygenase YgiN
MSWAPVAEFLKTMSSDPGMLGGAPEIWHSNQQLHFTRPELGNLNSPLILLAKLSYKPEKFEEALRGWAPVVESTKSKEPGVLTYSVGKDVEVENRLTLVEIYESKEYLSAVHMKGEALQRKIGEEETLRTVDPDIVFLKHVAGYWYK